LSALRLLQLAGGGIRALIVATVLLVPSDAAPAAADTANFSATTDFAAGDGPQAIAVGNFNGDPDPDLAVTNENSDNVSILLGGAGGSFGAPTNFIVGDTPVSIAVGNFNGDTDPDLAVANQLSHNVSILLGGAGGSFTGPASFAVGGLPNSVAVGHLNSDSNLDLAVASIGGFPQVSILLGNGDGTFGTASSLDAGEAPVSVAVGDFNTDSKPDLAVADTFSDSVAILLGNGDGTFGAATNFATANSPASVAVGDFNADSDPDLAVATSDIQISSPDDVSILLGSTGGSFTGPTNYSTGRAASSVAVADFNADSDPDLAVLNNGTENVSIFLGGAGGSFTGPTNFPGRYGPREIVAGDFNADSDPDLAVTRFNSDAIGVYLAIPWSAPLTLSTTGRDAVEPQVAVDQSGNTVFVWQRFDGTADCGGPPGCLRIEGRARSAAGVLGGVETLSASGQNASLPQVAVDANGDAVFVWQRYDGTTDCGGPPGCLRIEGRARSAAGVLSATQTLSPAGQNASLPQVAVDPNGNAVFVWQRFDGTTGCGGLPGCLRIQTRARSAVGGLSAPQTLSAPDSRRPQVGVDQNGKAVFVWEHYDHTNTGCGGAPCLRIEARTRSAAGNLTVTEIISPSGLSNSSLPQVALDPSGNAVFVWEQDDGTTNCGGAPCVRIETRARSAAGALSRPVQILSGTNAKLPQVGIDQSGNAAFVWERHDGTTGCGGIPGCTRIESRTRSSTGTLSAVQTLTASGRNAEDPQVAVDQSGNAVFVWVRSEGTGCGGSGCLRVKSRARSAAGALSDTATLSAQGQNADLPQVAVAPSGDTAAIWQRFDGTNWRVQAAVGP
jgi:FG-GAP-like repeat